MAKKRRKAGPKTSKALIREFQLGTGKDLFGAQSKGRASNIIRARIAKRQKAFRKKSGAAKRTKVGRSLKQAGVPFEVSAKDLTIVREPLKTAKVKIKNRNIQTKRRHTVHMKRASLFRVSQEGILRARAKRIEAQTIVISPRGRAMAKGVTDPFAAPPKDQPQGVQDFFLGSSAIRRMAYDPNTSTLEVVFTTGYGYHFLNVPRSVWINFQMAQSKGRFFMSQIYGHWSGKKGSKTYHPNYKYTRIF